ncbi:MAG: hypothetical protein OXU64_07560 [Gemmatimonadota bacterium]|nr:hypothetical protein [Gemmatimonadota bacterium]
MSGAQEQFLDASAHRKLPLKLEEAAAEIARIRGHLDRHARHHPDHDIGEVCSLWLEPVEARLRNLSRVLACETCNRPRVLACECEPGESP